VLVHDGTYRTGACQAYANVVNPRATERPCTGRRFLCEREDVHVVRCGQAPDQRKQRRDYPVLAGAVDAPGNYDR